ncbi:MULTISPECIES: fumarylacetoacetate hydrolase family protein [Chromohalobacter]|uniref:Fumarylacetoacetate hydrolase family protein n=1 Tax=Chromohalobacter canadensis TaxID=141389 RepID=A0ABZ0YF25_9GAMM|nr:MULTISPECIES: fumarylacetoacetate hydrolase family protein [Chromohalobacter]MCK0769546.1 fumarylacetoacetate hydrolase family protein [Chromohalobacter canadensis]WQH10329.1 fumarylacetoacetate hydrolase family protein [Chromohalobacter canadensis]
MTDYVFDPQSVSSVAIEGDNKRFPVRRIFCVGRNYEAHAREMGRDPNREFPFFFTKPADAIVPDGSDVPYPPETQNFHYEMELVVAIGKAGFQVPVEEANDYIYGYAAGNDLTRRDLQLEAREKGRPWDWGKAFDESAVISPLRKARDIGHPTEGRIWLAVNDEIKQDQDIADLIWDVQEIVSLLSHTMRIRPGDLIYTGTPAGVGPLQVGDKVTGGIDGVGDHSITIVTPREGL